MKKFIKNTLGDNVDEKTVLFKELDLIGDDADEFIQRFSETFEIDMVGFKFDEYFIEEYNIPFLYWYDRLFRKRKIKRKEFDVKHLEKIIKEKKWIDV
ncbi:MAG: DUF1493 family protein [Mangrovibacterium sp.]|nr:DUF1493 family protein [Mangrovibacterium sp.]